MRDESDTERERDELMRAGVRSRIARMAHATGDGARRWTPPVLLGVLCAGAFGPFFGDPAAAPGIAVAGAVGGNVLTDVIKASVDRLRGDSQGDGHGDGREATREETEEELARRIEEILAAGGTRAERLRADIAAVLHEIGAVGAALEEAIRTGDERFQDRLAEGIARLAAECTEFGAVIGDVREATAAIQRTLRRQDTEHRYDRDQRRLLGLRLRLMDEKLAVIEARTRPGTASGTGAGADTGTGTNADADETAQARGRSARWPQGCPYRGLAPFDEDQAEVFYGREHTTMELVGKLGERLSGPALVMVTGASGAGKSSLIRAGLLPALARGSLSPEAAHWPQLVMTPTRYPVQELAVRLAALAGADPTMAQGGLAERPEQAHLLARQAVLAEARQRRAPGECGARLVLVVDQFEELFTLGADEARRSAFITALHAMASTPCGPDQIPPALVVIAVRGDFWDRCTAYPRLAEAVPDGVFVVEAMGEAELHRAITGPAEAAGLDLEAGLVARILAELRSATAPSGYETGALPWLSQAMLITYDHRESDRLTTRGYDHSGGVRHAVRTSAETTYDGLTPQGRDTARRIFQMLTAVGVDGSPARRRLSPTDLHVDGSPEQAADVDLVLRTFAAQRLLVVGDGTVEIAHDELLRAWPRLRQWLEGPMADRILHGQLIDDAAEWERRHRDPSYLYRGSQLAAVRRARTGWAADPDRYPVTEASRRFLDAATRAARRSLWQRRGVMAALAGLLIVAVVTAVGAVDAADEARRTGRLALSRQLAAESALALDASPREAMMLAVRAWRAAPTVQARGAVLSTQMLDHAGRFGDRAGSIRAAVSPDGRLAATGDLKGNVRLWDAVTHRPLTVLKGHTDMVFPLRFSPDGTLLAAAGPKVRVWEVPSGRPVATPDDTYRPFSWRPDGTLASLAFGRSRRDAQIRLWEPRTGRTLPALPLRVDGRTGTPMNFAFSPDGSRIGIGRGNGTADLLRAADGRKIATLAGHNGVVILAFSPNGLLATSGGSGDGGTVRFWNAGTGAKAGATPPLGGLAGVSALAFTPDEKWLFAIGSGSSVNAWELKNPRWLRQAFLSPDHSTLIDLDLSADGRTVIAAGAGGPTTLWRRRTTWLSGGSPDAAMSDAAVHPAGSAVTAIDSRGTAYTWDLATRSRRGLDTGPRRARLGYASLAYRSDGTLATASSGGSIAVFAPDGRRRATVAVAAGLGAKEVVFSPDGRLLAATATAPLTLSGGQDNRVYVWDARTLRRLGEFAVGRQFHPNGLAFSPDGSRLMAAGMLLPTPAVAQAGMVRVWRVPGLTVERDWRLDGDQIIDLAVSPDGRTIATVGTGRAIKLWNPAGRLLHTFGKHTSAVRTVAFSPDGRTLATGSRADSTIRLWDVRRRTLLANLTGHTGPPNTVRFSRDGRTLVTSSTDNSVGLWNTDPEQAVEDLCAALTGPTLVDDWRAMKVEPRTAPCR